MPDQLPDQPADPAYVSLPAGETDDGLPTGALVGGGLGVLGLGGCAALLARKRRRDRTCMTCQPHRPMMMLSEIEDDAHLDAGQRKEEQLGSVNYEVLVCPGCQASRTWTDNKWFSGHQRCPGCQYKTGTSTSRTIVHATYDHGGQVQVTESCKHCSHQASRTRYTAARTRPSTSSSSSSSSGSSFSSSSSSSGSSGFGGGSSSGGGSGSSW